MVMTGYFAHDGKLTMALFQSTDWLPCKEPTVYQEQFGVKHLAQGHFDMQLGEP